MYNGIVRKQPNENKKLINKKKNTCSLNWQEERCQFLWIFNLKENMRGDIPRNVGEVDSFSWSNFVNMPVPQLLSVVSHFLRYGVRDVKI